eukprot:1804014-Rhodomonas_salina.2
MASATKARARRSLAQDRQEMWILSPQTTSSRPRHTLDSKFDADLSVFGQPPARLSSSDSVGQSDQRGPCFRGCRTIRGRPYGGTATLPFLKLGVHDSDASFRFRLGTTRMTTKAPCSS